MFMEHITKSWTRCCVGPLVLIQYIQASQTYLVGMPICHPGAPHVKVTEASLYIKSHWMDLGETVLVNLIWSTLVQHKQERRDLLLYDKW